jgi:hypothetical protein
MEALNLFISPFARLGTWYRPILYSIISMISINVLVYSDLDRAADSVRMTISDKQDTFDFIVGEL